MVDAQSLRVVHELPYFQFNIRLCKEYGVGQGPNPDRIPLDPRQVI